MSLEFTKMHGAGNDFVIFDARAQAISLPPDMLRAVAHRQTGIGCDQVIILQPSQNADLFMRIFNADGTEVESCGNATRCVAWLIMEEQKSETVNIETLAGILSCVRAGADRVRADMGEPKFGWEDIPLSQPHDTLHLPIELESVSDPVGVSMGNPHAVFVVTDAASVAVQRFGPELERHALFPERANISFAQKTGDSHIQLRVWERGAGETLACGTAACATLVAMHRRGLIEHSATITLPGGELLVEWDKESNHVHMTGPATLSFSGVWYG